MRVTMKNRREIFLFTILMKSNDLKPNRIIYKMHLDEQKKKPFTRHSRTEGEMEKPIS